MEKLNKKTSRCQIILNFIIISIFCSVSYTLIKQNLGYRNALSVYQEYYNGAEALLDSLDHYDHWTDRLDLESYYFSKEKVDSLETH